MGKENFDISRQMQRDLIAAYKQVCGSCWTQRQAYERMVQQPAPRFYVTAKQASQVIARMVRGDFTFVDRMQPMRRQMYYDLFDVVMQLFEKREFIGKSLSYVMNFAVVQPAPRFYIGPIRAKNIRAFLRNGVYDNNGKIIDAKLPSYVRTREYQARKNRERQLLKKKGLS